MVKITKYTKINHVEYLVNKKFPSAIERHGNIVDWKKMHDDLLEKSNAIIEEANQTIEKQNKLIRSFDSKKNTEKPLHTKEKETLLKLIAGMAVEQYGFDPKSGRNEATKHIKSDLESYGISMDQGNILTKLREACDLLPPKKEE